MHGVEFMICVPSELLAAVPSLALRTADVGGGATVTIALVAWASLAITVPLLVQQRFFGVPNRVFMVVYGVWLILAACPSVKAGERARSQRQLLLSVERQRLGETLLCRSAPPRRGFLPH